MNSRRPPLCNSARTLLLAGVLLAPLAACAQAAVTPPLAPAASPATLTPPFARAVTLHPQSGVLEIDFAPGDRAYLRPSAGKGRVFMHAVIGPLCSTDRGYEAGLLAAAAITSGITGDVRAMLGADGLHLRISGEPSQAAQMLREIVRASELARVDEQTVASAMERELARLAERAANDARSERDAIDRLLSAINPAYDRPDAVVMASMTDDDVNTWLDALAGRSGLAGNTRPNANEATSGELPAGRIISVSGDFDAAEIAALVGTLLGKRVRGDFTKEVSQRVVRPVEVVSGPSAEAEEASILLAWDAPPVTDLPSYRASVAAARVLQARLRAGLTALDSAGQVNCTLVAGPRGARSTLLVRIRIDGRENAARVESQAVSAVVTMAHTTLAAMAGKQAHCEAAAPIDDAEAETVTDAIVKESGRLVASNEYWASVLATLCPLGISPDELANASAKYDSLAGQHLIAAAAGWHQRGLRLQVVRVGGASR